MTTMSSKGPAIMERPNYFGFTSLLNIETIFQHLDNSHANYANE